ncbi:MAG: DMT family transporter [Alphaproteobacteria bacterium]|nr:DMT family transporter [Alphaproteobacteria bacterium]
MHETPVSRAGFVIALASAIVFGLWPAAVRGIYTAGGDIVFALLVLTWARTLALCGFCLATKRPLFVTREAVRQGLIGGFFQAVALVTLYAALEYLPGPIAIIILFSYTLMLLFFMVWRGEMRLYKATVATTVTALVGLAFVLDVWHHQNAATIKGVALAFAAALASVGRFYVWGRQTKSRHPIIVGAESFLVAAVLISPAIFFGGHLPTTAKGEMFAFLGSAATSLAAFGMFYGVRLMGSFRWSLFAKMEPVFTAIFSALLLGEILKTGQYIGIVIVLGSLALFQIFEQKRITAR